jgi:hypothetical protein
MRTLIQFCIFLLLSFMARDVRALDPHELISQIRSSCLAQASLWAEDPMRCRNVQVSATRALK